MWVSVLAEFGAMRFTRRSRLSSWHSGDEPTESLINQPFSFLVTPSVMKLSRRRINRQLNKGEALHSLRSHLCYANQGEIRGQSDEQLRNQVGCLNLVTNAIIVWNTVYIEKVVQQLQQEGRVLNREDLMHIWPTRYAHVNVYGRYHFELEHVGKKRPFRSLHLSGFQA